MGIFAVIGIILIAVAILGLLHLVAIAQSIAVILGLVGVLLVVFGGKISVNR